MVAWDVYAQQLMPLGYGHPLWGPEPCPEFGEVHLGDVGYLREGYFCFLFNAMRSADDPANAKRGVPDGFEVFDPVEPMLTRRPNAIAQSQLHSKSLHSTSISATASAGEGSACASAGLRYECSAESGALLILKQPAHKTYLDCKIHIRKYIRKHLSSWCDFANEHLGIGLEEKDIIFVSGFTKTPIWAEAAFSHSDSSGELVISGGCFVPSASGEFRVSMSRCVDASVFSRAGPLDRISSWKDDSEPLEPSDQCIFLNYYKMKTRKAWWRSTVMQAAAGPHVLPDHDDDDDAASSPVHSSVCTDRESDIYNKAYDPVDYVLSYILKHSLAAVACASDSDLFFLFRDGNLPPDNLDSALETLSPLVVLDENDVGTIDTSFYNAEALPIPMNRSHERKATTPNLPPQHQARPPRLPSITLPDTSDSSSTLIGQEYDSSSNESASKRVPLWMWRKLISPLPRTVSARSKSTGSRLGYSPAPSTTSTLVLPSPNVDKVQIHWQLCPYDSYKSMRQTRLEFDVSRPIEFVGIRDLSLPITKKLPPAKVREYLSRKVSVSPPIHQMNIRYSELKLAKRLVTVVRPDRGPILVRDVLQALFDDLNTVTGTVTSRERKKSASTPDREGSVLKRPASGVWSVVKMDASTRPVDVLAGESYFVGLTRPTHLGDEAPNFWVARFGPPP